MDTVHTLSIGQPNIFCAVGYVESGGLGYFQGGECKDRGSIKHFLSVREAAKKSSFLSGPATS